MYAFTFHRPTSLKQVTSLFASGDEAKLLAGGHTLLPTMKQRLAAPENLIDLSKVQSCAASSARRAR
jgi:carbon-monoxide dehydrogenase medium subunit